MATMRMFKPANERYQNSYSYQSAYSKPSYGYGLGQNHTQQYSESQFQNQISAIAPVSHASSASMQQSSYSKTNSMVLPPIHGGFPMNPVEQHSSSQAYSQHGSSYGMGHQSALTSAQQGSYGMRRHQGGFGGMTNHGASYDSAQSGLLGPVQQPFASSQSQQGSYSYGNHGAHNVGHQGSFSSGQHGSFSSAAHAPATNYAMRRRQKSSFWRRSNTGFRSIDSSGSEEEEDEESENEHFHH